MSERVDYLRDNTVKGLLITITAYINFCIVTFLNRHCLRVRYRTSRLRGYGSGTGPLDTDSRGPVPDPEPRLWGLSRGPVVCETTTDKSRDTGDRSVPVRICSYSYFTNKNSCWSFTLLRPPSLILKGKPICLYCHASHYSNN